MLKWIVGLLRTANPDATPDNQHYNGWLWANAMSFMEGMFYEQPTEQADSTRESKIHRAGALSGIDHVVGLTEIANDGNMPTWRWYVPKAMGLWIKVKSIIDDLDISALVDLGSELSDMVETIDPYVYEVLDVNGEPIG